MDGANGIVKNPTSPLTLQPWDTQLDEAFEEHRGALRMSRDLDSRCAGNPWVNHQGCVTHINLGQITAVGGSSDKSERCINMMYSTV